MRLNQSFTGQRKKVYQWLMLGCILIGAMVVIGGITRLTQSGLSMVKWEPIMGIVPPLNQEQWMASFELYKQSPEFLHYNSAFTLSDYKAIFFWEYLHRLIGRLIGLVFLIPCVIFWVKGSFDGALKKKVLLIFAWGAFQGVLGWLMVKSGLVDNPHVSHYRLAAHLITALGLMAFIYWVALGIKYVNTPVLLRSFRKWILIFAFFVVLQIVYGAFLAGLKAGLMYNTFPKMGSFWFPEDLIRVFNREGVISWTDSGGMVQFAHRMIAYCLLILMTIIIWKAHKIKLTFSHKLTVFVVAVTLFTQIMLGILTLIYAVPVAMGVLHQFVAMLLLLSVTRLVFAVKRI